MNRQPWCMGSGRQVGVPHTIGGRLGACTYCRRTGLQINRDGTLRYHVAVPIADDLQAPVRPSQGMPLFR